jgi:hypothetical protein
MVQCGAVRCGAVWYSVVQCSAVTWSGGGAEHGDENVLRGAGDRGLEGDCTVSTALSTAANALDALHRVAAVAAGAWHPPVSGHPRQLCNMLHK